MTTLKIVRKGQNAVIKAVQTIITYNEATQAQVTKELMEKLRHPDLKQRVENALKDFKLCLEEGDDMCVYRVIGQTCSQDQIDDFNTSVSELLDFLHAITIPAEEKTNGPIDEAKQIVRQSPISEDVKQFATSEDVEFIKTLLKDFEESTVYGASLLVVREDGFDHARMTAELWKELLTSFIKTHGQQG